MTAKTNRALLEMMREILEQNAAGLITDWEAVCALSLYSSKALSPADGDMDPSTGLKYDGGTLPGYLRMEDEGQGDPDPFLNVPGDAIDHVDADPAFPADDPGSAEEQAEADAEAAGITAAEYNAGKRAPREADRAEDEAQAAEQLERDRKWAEAEEVGFVDFDDADATDATAGYVNQDR